MELIEVYENGLLVPPEDDTGLAEAPKHLDKDEQLRNRFVQASHRTVADGYSLNGVARKYIEL